jgi:hypothetical protein
VKSTTAAKADRDDTFDDDDDDDDETLLDFDDDDEDDCDDECDLFTDEDRSIFQVDVSKNRLEDSAAGGRAMMYDCEDDDDECELVDLAFEAENILHECFSMLTTTSPNGKLLLMT